MPTFNLVLDGATFSVQGTTGGDDGSVARTLSGSAVTFKVDRCRVRYNRQTADHSTGQDAIPLSRTTKIDWQIDVETKLDRPVGVGNKSQPLATILGTTGVVVKFVATTPAGGVEGFGLVQTIEWTHDSPGTLSFTLVPYGADLTVTTTAS